MVHHALFVWILCSTASCGWARELVPRIQGGQIIGDTERHPASVKIVVRTPNGTKSGCTGTLIAKRYVLTSAHCVHGVQEVLFVVVNALYLKDVYRDNRNNASLEQRRKLNIATFVRTIFHPAYAAVERTHDVAVLELAEDMNATNIPFLYGRPAFNATKMSIQGYGWAQDLDGNGRLRNAVHDGRLRQVTVDVISEADCIARHGAEYNSTCAYTHCICAGGPYKGALKGDSGGAAYVMRNGQLYQLGLTKSGNRNPSKRVDIYERVATYCSFIEDATKHTALCDYNIQI